MGGRGGVVGGGVIDISAGEDRAIAHEGGREGWILEGMLPGCSS